MNQIAKAKAASINVSSRVISIPRNLNPRSRGNASKSAGIVDAISTSRSVICRLANQELGNRARLL